MTKPCLAHPLPPVLPASGRRRVLAIAGLLLGAPLPWRPVFAHHGFAGHYDFSRPRYLAGRVINAYLGYPHARITLKVPDNLHLPRDLEWMRALEDAEARQTTTILVASERRGIVDVSLDRRLTRRLLDEPGWLEAEDPLEAVVYRRTSRDEYRNELHAVLLALPDGRLLVSSSTGLNGR